MTETKEPSTPEDWVDWIFASVNKDPTENLTKKFKEAIHRAQNQVRNEIEEHVHSCIKCGDCGDVYVVYEPRPLEEK